MKLFGMNLLSKQQIAQVGDVAVQALTFQITPVSPDSEQLVHVKNQHLLQAPRGDEYLTVSDAAKQTKLSEDKIRQLCNSGEVRASKNGRQWLVSRNSLNEYIENTTQTKKK